MKTSIDNKAVSLLAKDIYDAVLYYLLNHDMAPDKMELHINKEDFSVALRSGVETLPGCDYFNVKKLLRESGDGMMPDDDKIASFVAVYSVTN